MQGAAVCAAMRNKRREKGALNLEELERLIVENPQSSLQRMEVINQLLRDTQKDCMFSMQFQEDTSKSLTGEQVRGLMEVVKSRIHRAAAYRQLLGTLCFFLVFIGAIYSQDNVSRSFIVESSIINSLVDPLPKTGQGAFTLTGPGTSGFLASERDVYDWMDGSLFSSAFSDPLCGDGVCDSPDEYPGFGRFGCAKDCGTYTHTTTMTIDLKDIFGLSATELGWDLSAINAMLQSRGLGPSFKYNVYSHTMSDFLFEQDLNNQSVTVEVPDGRLDLVLYQTELTATSTLLLKVQNRFGVLSSTVPPRSAGSTYEYGAPREAIAQATLYASAIEEYCMSAGTAVAKCASGAFNSNDLAWRILGAYGLKGRVTMKRDNDTTGTLLDTLASVSFCSPLPDPTGGITSTFNKQFATSSATACPSASTRRSPGDEAENEQEPQEPQGALGIAADVLRRIHEAGHSNSSESSASMQMQNCNARENVRAQADAEAVISRQKLEQILVMLRANNDELKVNKETLDSVMRYITQWHQDSHVELTHQDSHVELRAASSPPKSLPQSPPQSGSSGGGGGSSYPAPEIAITGAKIQTDKEPIMLTMEATVTPAAATAGILDANRFAYSLSEIAMAGPMAKLGASADDSPNCASGPFTNGTLFLVEMSAPAEGITKKLMVSACVNGGTASESITREIVFGSPPVINVVLNISSDADLSDASAQEAVRVSVGRLAFQSSNLTVFQNARVLLNSSETQTLNITQAPASRRAADASGLVFTIRVRLLAEHNAQAQSFKSLVQMSAATTVKTALAVIGIEVGQVEVSITVATSPSLATGQRFDVCSSHYDCNNMYCSAKKECMPCHVCLVDSRDSITGECPQDVCPGSGGFPQCIDGQKFLKQTTSCPSTFSFEVWKYRSKDQGSPQVVPKFEAKEHMITPNNRLVGAIEVSQRRLRMQPCQAVQNSNLQKFTGDVGECRGIEESDDPFGYDPAFMPFSPIYNGKLRPQTYYNGSEIRAGSFYPFGFYSHKYNTDAVDTDVDGVFTALEVMAAREHSSLKNNSLVMQGQENEFKLFFDERLTFKQASAMLTYANNGSYIDRMTSQVSVRFVTYNRPWSIFSICKFDFEWDEGGKIKWDYSISSLSVEPIPSTSIFFGILVLICLAINLGMEIDQILIACRRFQIKDYVLDLFNWIDWTHLILVLISAILFIYREQLKAEFEVQEQYPVLFFGPQYSGSAGNNATSVTKPALARMFRTNVKEEYEFLKFLSVLEEVNSTNRIFQAFSGVALVMFLLRVLKSLDFQERMGLVTRTLNAAASDLLHFVMLFLFVFCGYSVTGNLLFGHGYSGMSTFSDSMMTLFMILMDFDSNKFWSPMMHAAGPGAFHVFLWSYIFVSFFILMNMLLAIIVDSYAHVKSETEGSRGLWSDLADVSWHGIRRVLNKSGMGEEDFVSDQMVLAALERELEAIRRKNDFQKKEISREVIETHEVHGHHQIILLPGTKCLTKSDVSRLMHFLPTKEQSLQSVYTGPSCEPGSLIGGEDRQETPSDDSAMVDGDAIFDLMKRYGSDPANHKTRQHKELFELIQLENHRRILSLQMGQAALIDGAREIQAMLHEMDAGAGRRVKDRPRKDILQSVSAECSEDLMSVQGKLEVTVVRASNLPKMDLFRKCDPYCIVWIDHGPNVATFLTEFKKAEDNPVFDETFTLEYSRSTTKLYVSVWDRDTITADDLIGCVYVDLATVPPKKPTDLELPLINPPMERKVRISTLSLRVNKLPDGSESFDQGDISTEHGSSDSAHCAAPPKTPRDDPNQGLVTTTTKDQIGSTPIKQQIGSTTTKDQIGSVAWLPAVAGVAAGTRDDVEQSPPALDLPGSSDAL